MNARRRFLRQFSLACLPAVGLVGTRNGYARDVRDTIQRIKVSVVAVGTFEKTRSPAFEFLGTGFSVGDGSVIVTNAHVVTKTLNAERRETMAVALAAGAGRIQVHVASVLASDAERDLATLGLSGARVPPMALGDSNRVREGDDLYFTGFPIGSVLGVIPVTHRATVSALTPLAIPQADASQLDARAVRRLAGPVLQVIQLDAISYPGSSGSPLYEPESGEVVGIVNSALVKGSREAAISAPSGIAFAVPVNALGTLLRRTP